MPQELLDPGQYFCALGPRAGVWDLTTWDYRNKQFKNCSQRWLGRRQHYKPFCSCCPFYRRGGMYDPNMLE